VSKQWQPYARHILDTVARLRRIESRGDLMPFALRPRRKGKTTVVDEIVEQAAETANVLLVPEGLAQETWGPSAASSASICAC
jgi:hypothetical protein